MELCDHRVIESTTELAQKMSEEIENRKKLFQMIKHGTIFSCDYKLEQGKRKVAHTISTFYLAIKKNCPLEWQTIELTSDAIETICRHGPCDTVEMTFPRKIIPFKPIFEEIENDIVCLIPTEKVEGTNWQWHVLVLTKDNIEIIIEESDLPLSLVHFQEMNELKIRAI